MFPDADGYTDRRGLYVYFRFIRSCSCSDGERINADNKEMRKTVSPNTAVIIILFRLKNLRKTIGTVPLLNLLLKIKDSDNIANIYFGRYAEALLTICCLIRLCSAVTVLLSIIPTDSCSVFRAFRHIFGNIIIIIITR